MLPFYLSKVFLVSELMWAGSVLQMPSIASEHVCGRQFSQSSPVIMSQELRL